MMQLYAGQVSSEVYFSSSFMMLSDIILLQAVGDSVADKLIIIVLLILFVFTVISLQRNRKILLELEKKNRIIQKQALEIADKNKRLEVKNQALQELNEEKNNVIGVVSHDLRAPLNRIFALSNLIYLSSDNLSDDQRDYLEKMNQVVRDGLDLIRNFLDIRAIEYKGIQMKFEEIDLIKLLKQMVRSYNSSIVQKKQNIVFVNECEAEVLFIESDKQYLNRILDNLLSNAVKFSAPGREIKVILHKDSEVVKIRIEDRGPGISPEDQRNLFKKFQVLSARPTAGETSTGLGLSITKSLVDILEGTIRYEDNPDGGAVFIVELPVLTHA